MNNILYRDYLKRKKKITDKNLHKLIRKFIIDRQLIFYGGEAIDQLIINKSDGKDSLYDPKINISDYDVMSLNMHDDISDLKQLLDDNNYRYTRIVQAFHKSTKKIFTSLMSESIVDISLINLDKLDLLEIISIYSKKYGSNIDIVNPHHLKIDQYHNISMNLYRDLHRYKKAMRKLKLLEKYFPFPGQYITSSVTTKLRKINNIKNIIIGGDYAFSIYYPNRIENPVPKTYELDDDNIGTTFYNIIDGHKIHTRAFLTYYYYNERFINKTSKHDWKIFILTHDPLTLKESYKNININIL